MKKSAKHDGLTISDIIDVADAAYPDGLISRNFNYKTKKSKSNNYGDGLANFIVRELIDTFGDDRSNSSKLADAANAMERAHDELNNVAVAMNEAALAQDLKSKTED